MTQLNEILEDDGKLTTMVQEMDEVCEAAPTVATESFFSVTVCFFLSPPSSSSTLCCAFPTYARYSHGNGCFQSGLGFDNKYVLSTGLRCSDT